MKNKKFDCVKMKWDIQKQILRESAGLSDEDARKAQMERILKSPVLGAFYRKLRPVSKKL